MGLLTGILTLPLAPLRGTAWVVDQVLLAAEREYYDPEPVRAQLAALVDDLANGRVEAEEFDRREDALLDRLDEIEAYRRRTENGS
ncbi:MULTISPECIES: gas vesicle protein GvpG [Streptomyces]|uniref:Gas vesicle synthesis protein n=1 Tax=Streptomyces venezuelae (strain ATCC 10712 / CBS 650.69 / DSM 40230 / JCM 4526 / NBRC 13096 / PD 04745) TaxID=953739 RepID=F2R6Y1_STRVP|nr:gas vesicle protein GvpG [Streptomyces venezuelae]APE19859.1 gas vesicle protein [Streptomyces venezuelae]QER97270.1 gas vesicle protein [Streptomyces venezuelae ATCC 10712]QES04459.1 gas vesicle protein [Streptomyces venezuelae]QES16799.1 gas vesicle protein [Streptomyces venezuelae]CCA53673.1 gas vesicle synthesis protein [Streptomyces venezuelae ATCC 10712]